MPKLLLLILPITIWSLPGFAVNPICRYLLANKGAIRSLRKVDFGTRTVSTIEAIRKNQDARTEKLAGIEAALEKDATLKDWPDKGIYSRMAPFVLAPEYEGRDTFPLLTRLLILSELGLLPTLAEETQVTRSFVGGPAEGAISYLRSISDMPDRVRLKYISQIIRGDSELMSYLSGEQPDVLAKRLIGATRFRQPADLVINEYLDELATQSP